MNDQPATQQVIQQSAPTNPQVTATTNNLLTKLDTATNAGVPVFNESLFSPAGSTTQQGWQGALTAANNPGYSASIGKAIDSLGNAAAGNDYGTNDPGYATLRANAGNDALTSVMGAFNNSGRLGGGSNVKAAGEGVTNALAGLDYANFQNDRNWQATAAGLLPQAFQSSLLPSSAVAGVGAAQDANQQGILQGRNDLFQRQQGNQWDTLARASGILNGTTANSGTTTTTTSPAAQQTPWWQSALGLGIGAAGAFL